MSVKEFYEIEQSNLLSQSKKVSLFTKHPGTIGSFREELLKSYLRKFTPLGLSVKSGFIGDYKETSDDSIFNDQTKQVDFLVYDNKKDITFFETENFAIVKPNSVYAAIEIKSTLTLYKENCPKNGSVEKYPLESFDGNYRYSGTLIDALENIKSISNIAYKYNNTKIFTAIFAFSTTFNLIKLYEKLDFQEIQRQLNLNDANLLPLCICVPGNSFVTIYENEESLAPSSEEGLFSIIEATEEHISLPLQLFTNTYYNNIRHSYTNKKPESGGIFTTTPGICKTFSKHFDMY
ncbi:DUF6602 domain-containing protein [Petroclostridium sp. X23]|uniref:DUF6602 domain-containing protein n=1 Tax=Petroclostridium sp. X23 TaxID=3045146 RepID=UPI0024ACF030|nr:DUF6602 domain-containing protein [Petroclostridium sp. X23]WHH61175.1 hypothetical protein QKW49_10930 [Petroclostridium sp. X23]